MSPPIPKNANEFIEQQLDARLHALEDAFGTDVLSIYGPLYVGVDAVVRAVVEDLRKEGRHQPHLTCLITTLGGFIEVVQRIVDTIRHHYEHVRFIVPDHAFSAGTVLAMSGDEIYMDYYSRLGPIDPQVQTAGGRMVPALGYLIQWERLLKKAASGKLTPVEAQLMIDGFDQAELYHYEQARELSIALLKEWLVTYKFKNWIRTQTRGKVVTDKMRRDRAESIARQLNNTERWHSHGYGISKEVLERDLQLAIDDLDADPTLCEKVKQYHSLLDDYTVKRGDSGIIHTVGKYLPFM